MTSFAAGCGHGSYRSKCIEYDPRPCVRERISVAYPNISDSGTRELITWDPPRISIDWMCPRRLFKLPMTSPMYSSGTTTSTRMTGSSSTGCARFAASLNAIDPAILNAISLESTSWYEPSYSSILTSSIGYPARTPVVIASRMP